MMAVVPDSLLLVRIQLDLAPVDLAPANRPAWHTAGHTAGNVVMQATTNASHTIADWTASPTEAWAARLGVATAAAMTQIDAAFPGRVIGAQILHGVTYEGNYPAAWSAAEVEGLPAGTYDHMWPDYSPDTAAAFCNRSGGTAAGTSAAAAAAACLIPTAADRDNATLGNTLISADTPMGNASIAFNRFINVRMAAGIAAVGDRIKLASGGKAFITTLYVRNCPAPSPPRCTHWTRFYLDGELTGISKHVRGGGKRFSAAWG